MAPISQTTFLSTCFWASWSNQTWCYFQEYESDYIFGNTVYENWCHSGVSELINYCKLYITCNAYPDTDCHEVIICNYRLTERVINLVWPWDDLTHVMLIYFRKHNKKNGVVPLLPVNFRQISQKTPHSSPVRVSYGCILRVQSLIYILH